MATQACPRCGAPKLPHRVCRSCGYYAGKKRLDIKD
jgi:large subunit ribosomal protein L32